MKNYLLLLLLLMMTIANKVSGQAQVWDTRTSDYRGNGRDTPLEIPIIVVLWSNSHFTGTKRIIIRNEPNLLEGWSKGALCQQGANFNDVASSVAIHPGPDYEKWKARHGGQEPTVTLFVDWDFTGSVLIRLKPGLYSDLSRFGLNDQISSVRFDTAGDNTVTIQNSEGPAATISPIPVVLRLHTASILVSPNNLCGLPDNSIYVVQSSDNIRNQYGHEFNDNVKWVEVLKGPNWNLGSGVRLFKDARDQNNGGESRTYKAPTDADLVTDHFNDVLSSYEIIP